MGDGSGDLQRVWHEYVGKMFSGISILDVGAGRGLSKSRLANGVNNVTTQDINRAMMSNVDVIAELSSLSNIWDLVTAFDVIEHATRPVDFLKQMRAVARQGIFVTTPNRLVYDHPWHFTAKDFAALTEHMPAYYYLRFKAGDSDRIEEVTRTAFLNTPDAHSLGLYWPVCDRIVVKLREKEF